MGIRKFDGTIFARWKEMMQDMLIIRCQVEAIHHNNMPTSMTIEEWCSLDEIARLTIRMHMAENVYFSMAKKRSTYALCVITHNVGEGTSLIFTYEGYVH